MRLYVAPPLRGWVVFCTAMLVGLVANRANAGFLTQYTGWAEMANAGSSAGGIVNFAVYQNAAGHDWATDLGVATLLAGANAGGAAADTIAAYVYFYEVINTHPVSGNGAIANFTVASSNANGYTSGGWLAGTVFSDSAGAIGSLRNQYLGNEPPASPLDDASNTAPSHLGETLSGFIHDSLAVAPTGLNSLGGIDGDGAAAFLWTVFGNQLLKNGAYSPVLFLTSNSAPTYSAGRLSGTSAINPSDGGIAAEDPVAPEPATLVMCGIGAVALGVSGRRRKAIATG